MGDTGDADFLFLFGWEKGERCLPFEFEGMVAYIRVLQMDELKGVNAAELKSQVELLAFQAFPRSSYIHHIRKYKA